MRYDIGRWTMVGGSSGAPDTGNPGNCGTELELRDSGVSALPGGIGELAGLRVLNLFGNGGTTLPAGLGRLPNLDVLYLDDCPRLAALYNLEELHERVDGDLHELLAREGLPALLALLAAQGEPAAVAR